VPFTDAQLALRLPLDSPFTDALPLNTMQDMNDAYNSQLVAVTSDLMSVTERLRRLQIQPPAASSTESASANELSSLGVRAAALSQQKDALIQRLAALNAVLTPLA